MTYGPRQPPFNAPHPPQRPPMAPPPVVIDVARDSKLKALVGGSVAGVLGLTSIVSALAGLTTGGAGSALAVGILGLICLAIGLLPVIRWKHVGRPRKLVFDGFGVRWDDPRGRPWAVAWGELSGVGISRTRQRRVRPADYIMRKTMVRIDLFPADQGFRSRHPDMEHLWEFHTVKNGYRLPLGSNPKYIPVIEHAMRVFRPGAYLGVKDEGFMVGLV